MRAATLIRIVACKVVFAVPSTLIVPTTLASIGAPKNVPQNVVITFALYANLWLSGLQATL